jgi:phospholipid/cholesterol/gamma-HCH transport system substrate-binding protein
VPHVHRVPGLHHRQHHHRWPGRPGPDTYTLTASFDDVTGLLVNDNVKVAGVPVGKVTGVEVEEGQAVVRMEIDADQTLPADSAAAVRWRNLIGQRYVYLFPGETPHHVAGRRRGHPRPRT